MYFRNQKAQGMKMKMMMKENPRQSLLKTNLYQILLKKSPRQRLTQECLHQRLIQKLCHQRLMKEPCHRSLMRLTVTCYKFQILTLGPFLQREKVLFLRWNLISPRRRVRYHWIAVFCRSNLRVIHLCQGAQLVQSFKLLVSTLVSL